MKYQTSNYVNVVNLQVNINYLDLILGKKSSVKRDDMEAQFAMFVTVTQDRWMRVQNILRTLGNNIVVQSYTTKKRSG